MQTKHQIESLLASAGVQPNKRLGQNFLIDLNLMRLLIGHANISTTQIYTHLDFQHLAKVYDEAHPRAKKRARSIKP